mgnify:CR=1 FL=1
MCSFIVLNVYAQFLPIVVNNTPVVGTCSLGAYGNAQISVPTEALSGDNILLNITFPATSVGCVKKVVTELAVLEIKDGKFHLIERAPGVSVEEIIAKTEGDLVVPDVVPEMQL